MCVCVCVCVCVYVCNCIQYILIIYKKYISLMLYNLTLLI